RRGVLLAAAHHRRVEGHRAHAVRQRCDRRNAVKRGATLAVALIAAPFLLLIMVILLVFGGAGIDVNSGENGNITGGRPLKQLAVPDWAYGPLLAASQLCPEITAPLLAAQLEVESNWNPNAHNAGSGADGLAQFIPPTWTTWGRDGDG